MAEKVERPALERLGELSRHTGLDITGTKIRRTSSRFCLGVEHGDYNGTELFGVGTDRFIWMAYKGNPDGLIRVFSGNFSEDGIITFQTGQSPPPRSPETADTWGRFIFGVDHILHREQYPVTTGMDALIFGNIPGGGMSRSASLTLNLILSLLEVNAIEIRDQFRIVEMAQAVETDYIGSPCGQLDQIMILFAREGMGTHYLPREKKIRHIPYGGETDFRLVSLDTGTVRPGLEKSTYRIRRAECESFVKLLQKEYPIDFLADIKDAGLYNRIIQAYEPEHPDLCRRLRYIYHAQKRFSLMLRAWEKGDIAAVGGVFRKDGFGLRDDYDISGPELESMCTIARSVEGVLGERMLGGGDKGASGAICRIQSFDALKKAVDMRYPRLHPAYKDRYAVHGLHMVQGVTVFTNPSPL